MKNDFDWVDFYTEFARILLQYSTFLRICQTLQNFMDAPISTQQADLS